MNVGVQNFLCKRPRDTPVRDNRRKPVERADARHCNLAEFGGVADEDRLTRNLNDLALDLRLGKIGRCDAHFQTQAVRTHEHLVETHAFDSPLGQRTDA